MMGQIEKNDGKPSPSFLPCGSQYTLFISLNGAGFEAVEEDDMMTTIRYMNGKFLHQTV
jgi:hypothetical protein